MMAGFAGYAQTVGQFRYDTTKFLKVGGINHLVIDSILRTTDTTLFKPLVIDAGGRIRESNYWFGGGGGSGAYYPSLNVATNYIPVINDSTIGFDSCLVAVDITRIGDSLKLISGCGARLGAVYAPVGGGGGTPAGSTGEIQYNNAGAFGASSNFVWDNSNKRIGIGTTPSYMIDGLASTNGAIRYNLKNSNSGNSAQALYQVENDEGNALQMGFASSAYTTVGLNTARLAYIQSNGGRILFKSNSRGALAAAQDSRLTLAVDTTDALTVYWNGNVRIGPTVDSSAKLVVGGDVKIGVTGAGSTGGVLNINSEATGAAGTFYYQNGTLRGLFGLAGVANQLIAGSATGDFCIRNSQKVIMSADGGVTGQLVMSTAGALKLGSYGAGTLTTDASGNVTATSDITLKKNIKPFKAGLAEVLRLNPIMYSWNEKSGNETKGTYAGFSAQNVKAAIPFATGVMPDGTLTLQDRAIMAAMVNAIQELSAEVDKLKKIIATK